MNAIHGELRNGLDLQAAQARTAAAQANTNMKKIEDMIRDTARPSSRNSSSGDRREGNDRIRDPGVNGRRELPLDQGPPQPGRQGPVLNPIPFSLPFNQESASL